MASSSAGATGIGSGISLITVQNSGSDGRGRADALQPPLVAGLVRAPSCGICGVAAPIGARGRSRILGTPDLATIVLTRPFALAIAFLDPRGMVQHRIERAGLDLEP